MQNKVLIDLLFNLLLTFVALFFLSFLLISEPKEEQENTDNKNSILITMRWSENNDMDLWLLMPNKERIGYSSREAPNAHLDVDIVQWREFNKTDGSVYKITNNEEIISIQKPTEGDYCVNVHYYNDNGYGDKKIAVEIIVYDVNSRRMIFAGTKEISVPRTEMHFVKFTVVDSDDSYYIDRITEHNPVYFLGE